MKSIFTAKRVQPCSEARSRKPGADVELVGLLEVAVHEHVFPGDEDVVEHEDGVVFVQARRQRVVERAAEHGGAVFVGDAAQQLHARRVGRHDEDRRELRVGDRHLRDMRDEGEVRQRRVGGDDLRATGRRCRRRSP